MTINIARITACRAEARGQRSRRAEAGFSIIEMLIATVIMMAVTAATFELMNPAHGMFAAQPEVSDMQQRLRIAVETLQKDLLMAGGGTYSGNNKRGSLGSYVATILPDREGNISPDPPGTYKCTTTFCGALGASDTITIMYVPPTSAQTTLSATMPSNSAELKVKSQDGCDKKNALCGFKEGMQVMIFDDSGTSDVFSITEVQSDALHLQHKGTDLSKKYEVNNTYVTQIAAATYWLKTDTVAETYQLMRYDGYQTDAPIAENIVGLAFEYFAEPSKPVVLKNVNDTVGPWTNYGPKPPDVVINNPADTWGAGENCLFMVSGGAHVARPEMPDLGPVNGPLVKLTPQQLTDGPFCPDASIANRYDADLLRIRKVRVTLRVQVGNKSLRGPIGPFFLRGGTGSGGVRYIPDQEISFEVTPRNLNFGR